MENILITKFPDEVEQIVSRIGAAEVPTDPMSMEEIDMIIKLKPKTDWKAAEDKEELADKFKEALMIIPGIEYEFTQPIEMRFNELITGVRSDIAVKIFGEDLDYINQKAIEIKNLISDIPGASDIILEKTSGLPQIKVSYNRKKIAYYGLDINTLNSYLSAAFGGEKSGVVFEGEKRFDLVMRFDKQYRTDIQYIQQLQVPIPSGSQVPLSELADISYTEGPAKISRENTHRRVVVSVNVRNRDLQSVVEDIQSRINGNINLAPGNYIEYGGQFENLHNATRRLMLAVPVALLLIFIFLHFAFKSLKDAVMIFTAIPLATVGGVFLLWIRGMPFSVSAGVGFIALFGIAVLNGIVLIEHLKELQNQGLSMRELIMKGTKERLRPVLLTAGAAALGFLPMAVSTGAGAEVQRPLATVVIGGLVTSTMLTMIALPLLFEIFYNVIGVKFFPLRFIRSKSTMMILLLLVPFLSAWGQDSNLKLNQVVEIALQNNKEMAALKLKVEQYKQLEKTAYNFEKTTFTYGTDQNNIAENGYPLNVLGVTQNFNFPSLYPAQHKTKRIETSITRVELNIRKNQLVKEVATAFFEYQNLLNKEKIFKTLDSLYAELLTGSEMRFNKGDLNNLEVLNMKAKKNQMALSLKSITSDIDKIYFKLKTLLDYPGDFTIDESIEVMEETSVSIDSIPEYQLLKLQNKYTEAVFQTEKHIMLPDFSLNYFLGSNIYDNSKTYHGFEIGLSVPLLFGSQKSKINAAKIAFNAQNFLSENEVNRMNSRLNEVKKERTKYKELIDYYNLSAKPLYDEIMRTSVKSYQLGEIGFYQFINSYETAVNIQLGHFENVNRYNLYNIELQYFTR